MNRRKIVCLCGSTRFEKEYIEANKRETETGAIVLSVGLFGHKEEGVIGTLIKAELDRLHLDKISMADEILVINAIAPTCVKCGKYAEKSSKFTSSECCNADIAERGYVGESTRNEIVFALTRGKGIRWINPHAIPVDILQAMGSYYAAVDKCRNAITEQYKGAT